MSAHARLGPSNHRWPHCAGSVREEAKYEDVAGAAAIDGTGSHLLLEMCLQNNVRAEAYDMQIIGVNHHDMLNGWMVDIDRINRVQMCLDYITRRHDELLIEYPNSSIHIAAEGKSNPGAFCGRKDWWGTVDITITVFDNLLFKVVFVEICDYKDGRGWVHANDNSQLQSYLGGITTKLSHESKLKVDYDGKARMTIVQPKTNPPVRYQDVDASDIIGFMSELSEAAKRTDDPDAPCTPDNKGGKGHCTWCKHKKNCAALTQSNISEVKAMTQDVDIFASLQLAGDITQVDATKLSDIADTKDRVNAIFKQVEDEIVRRIESGEEVTGYAMQPGNNRKVWSKSNEEIEKALRGRRLKKADCYPSKLISPAQVMKSSLLTDEQKSKIERDLISIVAGKLTLKKVARSEKKTDISFFEDLAPTQPQVEAPVSFI